MGLLAFIWTIYFLGFLVNHLRVRRRRAVDGAEARRLFFARASDLGLLLEGAGLVLVFTFRRPQAREAPVVLVTAALLLAAVSTLFSWAALRHLGRQWRIRAIVTEDHELVTTGPYSLVRHPIYASLLGMLLATGILITRWWALAAAVAVFIAGTEIRVRAEDGILARKFPSAFPPYKEKVPAYLPFRIFRGQATQFPSHPTE